VKPPVRQVVGKEYNIHIMAKGKRLVQKGGTKKNAAPSTDDQSVVSTVTSTTLKKNLLLKRSVSKLLRNSFRKKKGSNKNNNNDDDNRSFVSLESDSVKNYVYASPYASPYANGNPSNRNNNDDNDNDNDNDKGSVDVNSVKTNETYTNDVCASPDANDDDPNNRNNNNNNDDDNNNWKNGTNGDYDISHHARYSNHEGQKFYPLPSPPSNGTAIKDTAARLDGTRKHILMIGDVLMSPVIPTDDKKEVKIKKVLEKNDEEDTITREMEDAFVLTEDKKEEKIKKMLEENEEEVIINKAKEPSQVYLEKELHDSPEPAIVVKKRQQPQPQSQRSTPRSSVASPITHDASASRFIGDPDITTGNSKFVRSCTVTVAVLLTIMLAYYSNDFRTPSNGENHLLTPVQFHDNGGASTLLEPKNNTTMSPHVSIVRRGTRGPRVSVLPAVAASNDSVGAVDGGGKSKIIVRGGTRGSKLSMLEDGHRVDFLVNENTKDSAISRAYIPSDSRVRKALARWDSQHPLVLLTLAEL